MERQPNRRQEEKPKAADREPRSAQTTEAAPHKQHGDALIEGSGTRHGVQEADTPPEV